MKVKFNLKFLEQILNATGVVKNLKRLRLETYVKKSVTLTSRSLDQKRDNFQEYSF